LFALAVLYPREFVVELVGPLHEAVGNAQYIDFYFICRITYEPTPRDDVRFEVVVTFDAQLTSVRKVSSPSSTTVKTDFYFSSNDIKSGFATEVLVFGLAAVTDYGLSAV